ncbi:DUF1795 domain-containing protein [Massilia violaceinigra]|uniref:DUF1795 domain-containing protein n=1 Tax=Massilia violaceinigra TaxID=2045208 RepID=A0ABY4A616_9BURK|nr:DcrB-related protein [Massilia violaceinigra]UOD30118.1 DUF1795 domain-containing protein [Massilia violaceinigra]
MDYQINEGSFTIPANAQDRSVNMLLLNLGPGGLTLVATRDQVQQGEDLDGFVTRQLRVLASQVKGFKEHERAALTVGSAQLPAMQLASSFKQHGASMHQRLTVIRLAGSAVLVLTMTCAAPLNAEQDAYARQLLDSFVPASGPAQ